MADSDNTTTSGKSPAFQFYARDFDSGTRSLSAEEVGAYIRLLCNEWDKGSLPSGLEPLSRIAGVSLARMRRVWASLQGYFIIDPDDDSGTRIINIRLERERLKQAEYRRRQSDAGKKRWDSRGLAKTTAKPPAESQPETCSPVSSLQSSSSDSSQRESTATRAGEFVEWYTETHQRLFGVGYMGSNKDWQKALELCGRFSDAELRDGALVWFGQDDKFAMDGTRTIPKFASRITGCLQQAKARGIA